MNCVLPPPVREARRIFNNGGVMAIDFPRDSVRTADSVGQIDEDMSHTRASELLVPGANGNFQAFAANKAGLTNFGMTVQPEVINEIKSSGMGGAAVGVLGAGGSLPNGWNAFYCDVEVMALGEEYGLPFMELHVTYTNNSGGIEHPRLYMPSVAANTGEDWTYSAFFKQTDGAFMNNVADGFFGVVELGSDGSAYYGQDRTGQIAEFMRYKVSFTTVKTATNLSPRVYFSSLADGESLDVTFRIYAPQLELGLYANNPVPTGLDVNGYSAGVNCYKDVSDYDMSVWSVYYEMDVKDFSRGSWNRFVELGDGGANIVRILRDDVSSDWKFQSKQDGEAGFLSAATSIQMGFSKNMITCSNTQIKFFVNGVLNAAFNLARPYTADEISRINFGSSYSGGGQPNINFMNSIIYGVEKTEAEAIAETTL